MLPKFLQRVEFAVLAAWLVVVVGLYGLFELIEVARAGAPHSFDREILLAFREPGNVADPIGSARLESAIRDVTALGSTVVLTFVTAAVFIYLLIARQAGAALFVLVAVGGGQVVSTLLKLGIDRPRPDLVPHLMEETSLSFPSGHAMLSTVTYLTLGMLLARIEPSRPARVYFIGLAILLTLAVGTSRVYLGVHWPSDVLAGWCAGAAWAMLCWLAARFLLRRRGPDGA